MLLHILHRSARPKEAPAHPPSVAAEAVAVATCRAAQGRGCSAQAWLPADRQTCPQRAMGSREGRAPLPPTLPPNSPPAAVGSCLALKGTTGMRGDLAGTWGAPGSVFGHSGCTQGCKSWCAVSGCLSAAGYICFQPSYSLGAPLGAEVGGLSSTAGATDGSDARVAPGAGGSRRAAAAVVFMLEKLG